MTTHPVGVTDTKDFGPGVLRIGDLNGDGAPDLLVVQAVYETREITCLTALTLEGKVIWQTGEPSARNAHAPYSDLPVQLYDWDNDGVNEVLYVRQAKYIGGNPSYRERADRYEGDATMVVLDALTGKEKKRFAITGFCDLDGDGRSDIEQVRQLIELNGGIIDAWTDDKGEIQGEISINTRYLVLGDQPGDRGAAGTIAGFTKMVTSAEKLGIQKIPLPDLLQRMGWKNQTPVVRYGAGANPADFKAKAPEGARTSTGNVSDIFRPRTPPRSGSGGAF